MERLADETQWGITRDEYARRQRLAIDNQRKRIWAAMDRQKKQRAAVIEREGVKVFVTSSGMKAYVGRVPNRLSLTSAAVDESTRYEHVSLPYVSIQHGREG